MFNKNDNGQLGLDHETIKKQQIPLKAEFHKLKTSAMIFAKNEGDRVYVAACDRLTRRQAARHIEQCY